MKLQTILEEKVLTLEQGFKATIKWFESNHFHVTKGTNQSKDLKLIENMLLHSHSRDKCHSNQIRCP